MKQGKCIWPLSWSVHCNFNGDGKGGGCPPPPSPAWANFTLMIECTPESDCCYSVYFVVCNGNQGGWGRWRMLANGIGLWRSRFICFNWRKRKYIKEKTTAKYKHKRISIATVWDQYPTYATFPTPPPPHFSLQTTFQPSDNPAKKLRLLRNSLVLVYK